ncbi:hypothetical protein FO488_02390 [Geobacter sp. FeAm09]|uniref:hypothetical protein n=1 Tax=Geobacter sp. FeAm09 TaxID=2597769 RepID=UPI0011ECD8E2|nr:hypothetical protein [Geobacter sp. FeAm09]QEM67120.1 hypothetical protein FO488_02390 [Geobacter sp. FeAm09]
MKCPKCGYNSFEYNDNCPKCLNDLTGYKATYGLKAMALPLAARTDMARSMASELHADSHAPEDTDMASDIFSFDLGDDGPETPQGGGPVHDPFSFDDEPGDAFGSGFGGFSFGDEQEGQKSAQAKAEEDAFASLLESTPQKSAAAPAGKPAAAAAHDEFDLENFSWDDTPDPASDDKGGAPREDDFGSLFGGTKK